MSRRHAFIEIRPDNWTDCYLEAHELIAKKDGIWIEGVVRDVRTHSERDKAQFLLTKEWKSVLTVEQIVEVDQ